MRNIIEKFNCIFFERKKYEVKDLDEHEIEMISDFILYIYEKFEIILQKYKEKKKSVNTYYKERRKFEEKIKECINNEINESSKNIFNMRISEIITLTFINENSGIIIDHYINSIFNYNRNYGELNERENSWNSSQERKDWLDKSNKSGIETIYISWPNTNNYNFLYLITIYKYKNGSFFVESNRVK